MPTTQDSLPIVLTIAGSDSGGGAGIQADIKAISATGSYACSVITAITSQNTQGVTAVLPIPIEHVESQIDAVFTDLNIAAVKIGMLADANIISTVAKKLKQYQPKFVVLDPVMISTSGSALLEEGAIEALKSELIPLADIITPNLPEAEKLIGSDIQFDQTLGCDTQIQLANLGAKALLLKGGHSSDPDSSRDVFIQVPTVEAITAKRVDTKNTHGTGCTLSSAIASYLAQGNRLHKSVHLAKQYISQAIQHADELEVGAGHGPVHHFFNGHQYVR